MKKTEMAKLFDEMCDLACTTTPVVVSEDVATGRRTETPMTFAACFGAAAFCWCAMVAAGEIEPKGAEHDMMNVFEAAFRINHLRDERDDAVGERIIARRKLAGDGR